MKKMLTQTEEFEIMKLVLDKFLWLGFGIMAYGFFQVAKQGTAWIVQGIGFMFTGIMLLSLVVIILVKEYEVIR